MASQVHQTNRIDHLSFAEIEERIAQTPALILPLGGLEPLGTDTPLDLVNRVTQQIADELGVRMSMLVAPVVSYGASIPYMSFGGCSGLKPRHLETALVDLLRCWTFQGIRRFVLLDGTVENVDACTIAGRRHVRLHPDCTVTPLCWQKIASIRKALSTLNAGSPVGRCEHALRVLGGDSGGAGEQANSPGNQPVADPKAYTTWRRRGRDPEKFRAQYPLGAVYPPVPTVVSWESLFDAIVSGLEEALH